MERLATLIVFSIVLSSGLCYAMQVTEPHKTPTFELSKTEQGLPTAVPGLFTLDSGTEVQIIEDAKSVNKAGLVRIEVLSGPHKGKVTIIEKKSIKYWR